MLNRITRVRFRIPDRNDLLHRAHNGIHTSYFALVFIEGHGLYAVTGGMLCALSIANFFLHFSGE